MSNLQSISRRAFVGGMSASLIACASPRWKSPTNTADVIVIGAGLAGLHATKRIENAGYQVLLIEGSGRVGGRLHTLDDLPGSPDAGGIQIGAGYKRFHAIADELAESAAQRVSVLGHTDRAGPADYNLELSEERAANVEAALIDQGIPAAAIVREAFGERRPAVETADGVAMRANRRANIEIEY